MDHNREIAEHAAKRMMVEFTGWSSKIGKQAVLKAFWEILSAELLDRYLLVKLAEMAFDLYPGEVVDVVPAKTREVHLPSYQEDESGRLSTSTRTVELQRYMAVGTFGYDEETHTLFVHDPFGTLVEEKEESTQVDVRMVGYPAKMTVHRNDGTIETDSGEEK